MKKLLLYTALCVGIIAGGCKKHESAKAEADMPGDNLDLYAVLDLFKSSKNPEAFEKSLNDKSRKINNLDLNMDGKVDYIKVVDNKDGDDHAMTLRVPVSKTESQDVAVIEIEKTGDKTVNLQIIGDEKLYGSDVVIEPKSGQEKSGFIFTTVAVNVWYWPMVTYIYSPGYVVYVSPWEYDYYPVWYDPWEPVAWEVYYPAVYTYHSYYYPIGHPRFERAHAIYQERRMVSGYVMRQDYKHGGYHDNGRHNGNNNYAPRVPQGAPGGNAHPNERNMPGNNQRNIPRGNKSIDHGNNNRGNSNSPMRNDQIRHQYPSGGNNNARQPQHGGGVQKSRPQQPHGGVQQPRGGNHGGGHSPKGPR